MRIKWQMRRFPNLDNQVARSGENMSTISARRYRGCGRLTEVTKRCRTICETLKIPIPVEVRENMEIYSPEDLESILQSE